MLPNTSMPVEQVQDLFAAHGLRCTKQRMALYEALAATREHPTADQLYQSLVQSDNDISLATVYNTLEAFCDAGIAQKLSCQDGCARYDATVHNHVHLRDEKSGAVTDVPDSLGEQLLQQLPPGVLQKIEAQLGFKISRVQIEFLGEATNASGAYKRPTPAS